MSTTKRNMSTEENSRTPQLRFPGFRGEWVEKNLGEIGDIYRGLSGKSKEDFEKGGARFITFLNVMKNIRIDTNMLGVVNVREGEKQNSVKYGDLLFNTSSETPEEVGICSVYDSKSDEKVYLNSFCFGYRLKNHLEYSPLYIAYFFRSIYGRELMRRIAQGITRFNLSKEYFNKAEVPFPSLAEQQKIAECLSEMDSIIAAQGEQLDILKDKKKGLMQQLFPRNGETTPRLRFPGFSREWDVRTLGEIATKINRRNSKLEVTRVLTNSANEGIVDQSLYFDRNIAIKDNTANYYIVELEDFIYNPRISTAAPVGPISINKIGRGIISPLYTVFKIHTGCIAFFEQYFETTIWHPYLKSIANFGVRFDRMNITTEGFYNMPLLLPSIEEQQKIADCLKALDEQISAESAKLDALKDHKKGLMQNLFPQPAN